MSDKVMTTEVERPEAGEQPISNTMYGSDYIAEILRDLDIPFVALNPGASYRGLHDSIVNHLGNTTPQMLLCLHEEHAVAIAHGYAKIAEKPLAAIVHSNVGLMHASMAVFNAFCDRVPVLLLGATGPVDADKRRPWIDWLHTAQDQGDLIRNFIKWDDQPSSIEAARESLLRGYQITATLPAAPVYINLDAELQEQSAPNPPRRRDPSRYRPIPPAAVPADLIRQAADMLKAAKSPFIFAGRVSRSEKGWRERLALAEALGAKVTTDIKVGAAFPTNHRLHSGAPGMFTSAETSEDLRKADLILNLDWVDVAGSFKSTFNGEEPEAKVISVTIDHVLHNGWSKDHQGLPPVDLRIAAHPDVFVSQLVAELGLTIPDRIERTAADAEFTPSDENVMTVPELGHTLRAATAGMDPCLIRLPLSWSGDTWPFEHPLDNLGYDGGGGIGSGPGMAVGAALALKDTDRLPVAVIGDGDFMMGCTAIWTAARYGIPLLVVVANNHSFFNDEIHQERVAVARSRPTQNKWIGQRIDGPAPDIAKIAEAQGAAGFGPVKSTAAFKEALDEAIAIVRDGGVAVVDAEIMPGYDKNMTNALRGGKTG